MKKLRKGFKAMVAAFITSFILVGAVNFLVDKEILPGYSATVLLVFNIVMSIISLPKMRRWGISYAIGWLAGAIILAVLGLMDTVGIVLNIIAPSVFLGLRIVMRVRKGLSFQRD